MSKSQELRGFPIPQVIETEETRCIAVQIPDHDDYHRAVVAQLTMLGKWWKWERTNPQDKHASRTAQTVRSLLRYTPVGESIPCEIIDAGDDLIVTTTEELCEAVRCGNIKTITQVAQVLAGGLNSGITVTVDEEGNVIVDDGEGSSGSSQTTEAYQMRDGQAHYIYNRILEFIQDYEDFFGIFPSSQSNAIIFFQNKYQLTAGITDAVAEYYAHREGMNVQPQPPDDGLIEKYWCGGFLKQVSATYIIEESSADQLLLLSMLDALSQDQYEQWADESTEQARSDYTSYGCYPLPDVEITIPALTQNVPVVLGDFSQYASLGHTRAVRIVTEGAMIGANGEIVTATGWKDTDGSVYHDFWSRFRFTVSGNFPHSFTVPDSLPFNEAGVYSWIIELPSKNYDQFEAMTTKAFATGMTGSITVRFEDLLEVE